MLDPFMRRLIDRPLRAVAGILSGWGVTADAVTLVGFGLGLGAVVATALAQFWLAFALVLANRLADGLDGAIARHGRPTDRGGFLDIVLDFFFYGLMVLGFALAAPENALPAAFLLASFIATAASFMAYATIAAKRGITTERRGRKSFFHVGGLTEGTETIVFLLLACAFPHWFPVMAWIFGAACWVTALHRLALGWLDFGDDRDTPPSGPRP